MNITRIEVPDLFAFHEPKPGDAFRTKVDIGDYHDGKHVVIPNGTKATIVEIYDRYEVDKPQHCFDPYVRLSLPDSPGQKLLQTQLAELYHLYEPIPSETKMTETPQIAQVKLESLKVGDRFLVYEDSDDHLGSVSFKKNWFTKPTVREAVVLANNEFDSIKYGWSSNKPRSGATWPCFANGCNRYSISNEPQMVDQIATQLVKLTDLKIGDRILVYGDKSGAIRFDPYDAYVPIEATVLGTDPAKFCLGWNQPNAKAAAARPIATAKNDLLSFDAKLADAAIDAFTCGTWWYTSSTEVQKLPIFPKPEVPVETETKKVSELNIGDQFHLYDNLTDSDGSVSTNSSTHYPNQHIATVVGIDPKGNRIFAWKSERTPHVAHKPIAEWRKEAASFMTLSSLDEIDVDRATYNVSWVVQKLIKPAVSMWAIETKEFAIPAKEPKTTPVRMCDLKVGDKFAIYRFCGEGFSVEADGSYLTDATVLTNDSNGIVYGWNQGPMSIGYHHAESRYGACAKGYLFASQAIVKCGSNVNRVVESKPEVKPLPSPVPLTLLSEFKVGDQLAVYESTILDRGYWLNPCDATVSPSELRKNTATVLGVNHDEVCFGWNDSPSSINRNSPTTYHLEPKSFHNWDDIADSSVIKQFKHASSWLKTKYAERIFDSKEEAMPKTEPVKAPVPLSEFKVGDKLFIYEDQLGTVHFKPAMNATKHTATVLATSLRTAIIGWDSPRPLKHKRPDHYQPCTFPWFGEDVLIKRSNSAIEWLTFGKTAERVPSESVKGPAKEPEVKWANSYGDEVLCSHCGERNGSHYVIGDGKEFACPDPSKPKNESRYAQGAYGKFVAMASAEQQLKELQAATSKAEAVMDELRAVVRKASAKPRTEEQSKTAIHAALDQLTIAGGSYRRGWYVGKDSLVREETDEEFAARILRGDTKTPSLTVIDAEVVPLVDESEPEEIKESSFGTALAMGAAALFGAALSGMAEGMADKPLVRVQDATTTSEVVMEPTLEKAV